MLGVCEEFACSHHVCFNSANTVWFKCELPLRHVLFCGQRLTMFESVMSSILNSNTIGPCCYTEHTRYFTLKLKGNLMLQLPVSIQTFPRIEASLVYVVYTQLYINEFA